MKPVYKLQLHPAAEKQLEQLYRSDRKLAARFNEQIEQLARQPYPTDVTILERTEDFDLCRTRVGRDWRLLYAVIGEWMIVLIVDARARENAYKNLPTLLSRIEKYIEELGETKDQG